MIICNFCNSENPEGTNFCSSCGAALNAAPEQTVDVPAPQYTYTEPQYTAAPATTLPTAAKIMGIISMICGILSLCSCYVGFLYSIPAIILSNLANGKSAGVDNPKARLGKTLGIIGIPVSVVCFIAYIVFVVAMTAAGSRY